MVDKFKRTELGTFPKEWNEFEFQDILTGFTSGQTPYRAIKRYYSGEIPWITSGELNYNVIVRTKENITQEAIVKTNLKIVPPQTFLFAITGLEAEGTRGRCAITGAPATTNQSCMALFPKGEITTDYLFYFYRMYSEYLALTYCQGTKQQSYTAAIAKKLPIVLPPTKAEQTAIATALSDADALIILLERLIAKKKTIKQGAMQELLRPKKEWTVKSLSELFTILSTSNCSRAELNEEYGIGYIHYGDIHTKWKVFLDCSKTKIPFIQPSKVKNVTLLQDGDLIIADASEDYEGLGQCIEIEEIGNKKIVAGLHTLLLRCKSNELIKGFRGYFKSYFGIQQSLILNATGVSVYGISKTNLKNFNIYLPPIEEQTRIAQILSEMDAEINLLEKKLEKQKLIKRGMMQVLLTGKVRLLQITNA